MGVFDSITLVAPGGVNAVTIQRVGGPLESVADGLHLDQQVEVDGFGVDAQGNPYFDTAGPNLGSSATLWLNPADQTAWLVQ